MKVRIVYTGRGYHLAESLPEYLELEDPATVDDALGALSERLPRDAEIPSSCLVSLGGRHLGTVGRHEPAVLSDGDELTFIAPVAGG